MESKKCTNLSVKKKTKRIQSKGFSTKQKILSWIFGAVIAVSLMTIIIFIVLRLLNKFDDSLGNLDFQLVTRKEWQARTSARRIKKLTLPVKYIFISDTNTESCHTQSICSGQVRDIQIKHMVLELWSDISYNFLVGGDGLVYIGRSWDYEGAHTLNYNNISIGISFIGTFHTSKPTNHQLEVAQKLLDVGIRLGKISEDYVLLGHRQVASNLSPGEYLYHIIQSWPHWSSVVPEKPVDPTNPEDFRLVSREEWKAQPSKYMNRLPLPVKYVFISHTASSFCNSQSACSEKVKLIQTDHMESNGWSDIGYNFLIGGDGLPYVGRGWEYEGAHTRTYNKLSIGLSFIGNFAVVVPLKSQLEAAQKLLELGVKLGKISEDYKLLGHRQVHGSSNPGDALYHIIKTWPHWASEF